MNHNEFIIKESSIKELGISLPQALFLFLLDMGIKQEEIDKASNIYEKNKLIELGIDTNKTGAFKEGFIAGAEFTESKVEEILKEYSLFLGIETDGSLINDFFKT